jgi:hypothetical protein
MPNDYRYVQAGIYNYELIKIHKMTKKVEKSNTPLQPSLDIADVRQRAMKWWNPLCSARKTEICDTNTELVGSIRRWETLTGSEIEKLFCKEFSLFWNNCYNKTCVYNVSSTCKNRNIGSTCQGHVA